MYRKIIVSKPKIVFCYLVSGIFIIDQDKFIGTKKKKKKLLKNKPIRIIQSERRLGWMKKC